MKQRGFTLVEILVVVGVLGFLAPVLAVTVRQIVVQSERNTTRITAQVALEDTGRWLGQEIPLAQATNLVAGGPSLNTLELQWTDWADSTQYDTYSQPTATYERTRITYSLVGEDLKRKLESCAYWDTTNNWCCSPYDPNTNTCAVSNPAGWATTSNASAARKVASIQFTRSASPGYVFTVTVTSSPKGAGFPSETRTYTVFGLLMGSEDPL